MSSPVVPFAVLLRLPRRQVLGLATAMLLVLALGLAGGLAGAPPAAAPPSRITVPEQAAQWLPVPVVVSADRRIDLRDEMARFVVVPHATSAAAALAQLRAGGGEAFGQREELAPAAARSGPSSLYALFAYRTNGAEPIYLRYRLMSSLFAAVWLADEAGREFRLIGLGGAEAPAHRDVARSENATVSFVPTATLPAAPDMARLVLVRVDSVFPYWSNFSLISRYAFERWRAATGYLDGVFLGAMATAMAFALYGMYRRQLVDYLTFVLAAAALSSWYLVLREHAAGTELPSMRRMVVAVPSFAYFLLHGFGVWRLLYPRRPHQRKTPELWRLVPLWLAAAFCGLGLLLNGLYGWYGAAMPAPTLVNIMNESVFAVAPPLLLFATLLAPRPRLPGYAPLLAAELVGASGAALQWLRSNTSWLDGAIVDSLTQYPLPIEVLVWAVALNMRFQYLEMIAKRRVKAALHREAKRVREAMGENMRSREQALAALERSYRQLDRARQAMLDIVSTHAHAARGLVFRLSAYLGRRGEGHTPEAAEGLLDQLVEAVAQAELAVEESHALSHASASAASLLRWHVDARAEELAARGVSIRLRIAPEAEVALVDGYHFMELARELVSNLARYAQSGTAAEIELDLVDRRLRLSARNRGELRGEDENLRRGLPVAPAAHTLNGESSSGRGLSRLAGLLAGVGGELRCASEPPDRFAVVASLPLRGARDA